MSSNKIKTEIDQLVLFFQKEPNKFFNFETIAKKVSLPSDQIKKFISILLKEGFLEVEYKLGKEYYKWNKQQEIKFKPSIELKETLFEPQIKQEYIKIEQALEELLNKKNRLLELLKKRKKYLKKGAMGFAILEVYNIEIKRLKKEISNLNMELKQKIKQLK
jgi:hypothetical protein